MNHNQTCIKAKMDCKCGTSESSVVPTSVASSAFRRVDRPGMCVKCKEPTFITRRSLTETNTPSLDHGCEHPATESYIKNNFFELKNT